VIVMMTACLLALFSDSPITGYTLLVLPIAVQEMVFAVWLLVNGFSPSALQWRASSEDSTAVTRDVTTAKESQLCRVET
jgi:hypothetical protein